MAKTNIFTSSYVFMLFTAFIVTFIWASSWLFIKWGLFNEHLPPLYFVSFRFGIASFILLFFILKSKINREFIRKQNKQFWSKLTMYGIIFVTITQGALCVSLFLLPAITVTLILSFTIITAFLFSTIFLKEKLSYIQSIFILFALFGLVVYFNDKINLISDIFAISIAIIAMIGNAGTFVVGRSINKTKLISPLIVTGISMAIGSLLLFIIAIMIEPFPPLTVLGIFYILYLGVITTAVGFTLWNHVMQTLTAMDVTLVNSTVFPQIVVLSFLFLGEHPTILDWFGILIVGISIFFIEIIQARNYNKRIVTTV